MHLICTFTLEILVILTKKIGKLAQNLQPQEALTAVVDMPNTVPLLDLETFRAKESIAASKSVVDFGIGVNVDQDLTKQDWFDTIPAAFWKLYPYGISSDDFFLTQARF